MRRNRGGDTVNSGYYWNVEKWDATFVEAPAGELPGSWSDIYFAIPTVALLVAAPIMGAVFVLFLPFIGIFLLLQHITHAAVEAAGGTLDRVLQCLPLSRRPRLAFFAGSPVLRGHEHTPTANPERLGKPIEERHQG